MPTSRVRVINVLRQHSGYARTQDFERAGVGRWVLSDLVKKAGTIERAKHC